MEKRRGLRSLIPTGALSEPVEETIQEVPVEQITPNPYQPRKRIREEELAELVESVKEHGILQPLVARREGEGYQLIAGERRLEAAKRAGRGSVPVILREATSQQMLEWALVENLQREDMNAVEAAEAYHQLVSRFGLTQEQVAERVGKSRSAVTNALRLLALPQPVLDSMQRGEIEATHGRLLLMVNDAAVLLRTWRRVVKRGLSSRETEQLIAKLPPQYVSRETVLAEPKTKTRSEGVLDPNLQELQDRLTEALSAKVRLRPAARGKAGAVEISYSDYEDLDRISWRLLGSGERS